MSADSAFSAVEVEPLGPGGQHQAGDTLQTEAQIAAVISVVGPRTLSILFQLHRLTPTYPIINRSWRILWLVTGAEKAGVLVRLCDGF